MTHTFASTSAVTDLPVEELTQLRECVSDLGSIMALPRQWVDGGPAAIVTTLLDALLGVLPGCFVYARLHDHEGMKPGEMVRIADPLQGILVNDDIARIDAALRETPLGWPSDTRTSVQGRDVFVTCVPLGIDGELGMIAAGSMRAGFPAPAERLVLSVAASQAALGLHRRRALDADDERDRESRLIMDTIPGMVAVLTATGEIDVLNRQVLDYFGQTQEELRDWATNGTIHVDDVPHVVDVFSGAIAAGTPYEILQRFRRSDGVYRWFQNRGFPLRDRGGQIVRWCVLLIDVDERQHAETRLGGEVKLLEMVAAGRSLADILDALCRFVEEMATNCHCAIHLIDSNGQTFHNAAAPTLPASYDDAVEGRSRSCWSTPISSLAGTVLGTFAIYQRSSESPTPVPQDLIAQVTHIASIAIERAQSEAALERSAAFLADGQRLSLTGSFSWRVATDEITWSEQLYRIYDIEIGIPVTPELIRTRVHPDDVSLLEKMKTIHQGGTGGDFEWQYRLLMPDRSLKYLHAVTHAIRDQDGQLEYVAAIQDVTERRLSEEALAKARSDLAKVASATSLGVLTAAIAHEVNQPLSGIVTNAGTCLRMLDGDPPNIEGARETARRTIRDGNRASDVIARLRALFRKEEFTLESFDLNEAVGDVIALSLSDLRRNQIAVQSQFGGGLPLVTGDRIQLQQVILNLIRNASDAMAGVHDRPRQLLIKTECEDGSRVRVIVRDTGIGVDARTINKLFDSFYTTKADGMGIGLSVSRSIIERHQGRLWAEANEGPGAMFSFSIPAAHTSVAGA